MSKCKGPRAAGIQWECDMEHGVVDGRCAECQIMAEAGSNLSLEQIDAIRDARKVSYPCVVVEGSEIRIIGAALLKGGRYALLPSSAK
jgi:hypothetical protein